jgi:hypothetical protein
MACCMIAALSIRQMPWRHHEDLREAMLVLIDAVLDEKAMTSNRFTGIWDRYPG